MFIAPNFPKWRYRNYIYTYLIIAQAKFGGKCFFIAPGAKIDFAVDISGLMVYN